MMRADGIGFIEACDRLAVAAGLQSAKRTNGANGAHHAQPHWLPIVPPPADAPKPADKLLRCDMLHEYRDADDRVLFYVRRLRPRQQGQAVPAADRGLSTANSAGMTRRPTHRDRSIG